MTQMLIEGAINFPKAPYTIASEGPPLQRRVHDILLRYMTYTKRNLQLGAHSFNHWCLLTEELFGLKTTITSSTSTFSSIKIWWPEKLQEMAATRDVLISSLGAHNFPSRCLFFNFHIVSINHFPMHTQAASTANQPTEEVWETIDFKGVESKYRVFHG